MKQIGEHRYELSSGRRFYAFGGVIGLQLSRPSSGAFTGYDGSVGEGDERPDLPWTPEERAELALQMIAAWEEWAGQRGPRP